MKQMKYKLSDILTVVFFAGFLGVMMILLFVLPAEDFSEKEKRYLQPAPELTGDSLLSGEFSEQAEEYVADHVPGRDGFVMLSAYYDLLSNRQATKDIHTAEGDRLVEAPQTMNEDAVRRNMDAINRFAAGATTGVDLMIVPSAGFVCEDIVTGMHGPYTDDVIIADIYSRAGESVTPVDLLPAFMSAEDAGALYYRTDHHWTSLGAYTAYGEYMTALGRSFPHRSQYTVESHPGFCGSTYSRSGLWLCPPEDIELWSTGSELTVTNAESGTPHPGVFYGERLSEADKYTVFLDGNHSLVRIENADAAAEGKLLVIRDSYANCLGAFLADSYQTVVLVDLRYYRQPVSELLESEDFSDVLVCYSVGNFLTDSNIIMLR